MMNSTDGGNKDGGMPGMPGMMPGMPGMMPQGMMGMPGMPGVSGTNPMRAGMDANPNRSPMSGEVPDFFKRKPETSNNQTPASKLPGFPSFEEFKKQMESGNDLFNPFGAPEGKAIPKDKPALPPDDDLGFNVDELVKKIDAKIAELEEEEKRQKEAEKAKNASNISNASNADVGGNSQNIPDASVEDISKEKETQKDETSVANKGSTGGTLDLEDSSDEDDFFDDFFDS